jgi:predicted AAA+ superfamily ATPase
VEIAFKRTLEADLIQWSTAPNHKPLILNGARQVGKTYLMKWLGKHHFKKLAYFNFDEKPELTQFFENTKDVHRILENLSIVHGEQIDSNTLVIFDEIQECLPALNTLKYFYENLPQLYVISAGSLLGISLGKAHSFPVGKVQFLTLYPLGFTEFLDQCDPKLASYLKGIKKIEPIPDLFFSSIKDNFKKYLITGGLPAVASTFLETKDFGQADVVLNDLIRSYELDFAKHPIMKDIAKISYVWHSLPSQLGRENKKFVYQLVKPGARAREYEDAIRWLEQAGLVYRIHLCKIPKLPLSAYDDLSAYKIYVFDVGILRKQSKLDSIAFTEGNRLFVEFKGALLENYILQSLIPQFEVMPRYWTSGNEAEVDFIIQSKNEIIPIEVKSDENVRSRSLTFYAKKHSPALRIKYSLKNLSYRDGLLNIPHFMADYTTALLALIGTVNSFENQDTKNIE